MNITNNITYNQENINKNNKKIIKTKKHKNNMDITYIKGFLKIATHNVRGFNMESKQKIFRTYYKEHKLDIINMVGLCRK